LKDNEKVKVEKDLKDAEQQEDFEVRFHWCQLSPEFKDSKDVDQDSDEEPLTKRPKKLKKLPL